MEEISAEQSQTSRNNCKLRDEPVGSWLDFKIGGIRSANQNNNIENE